MVARLGLVLYWTGWVLGGSLMALAVGGTLFAGGNDSLVFLWFFGIPAVFVWLLGRAARFVLSGD